MGAGLGGRRVLENVVVEMRTTRKAGGEERVEAQDVHGFNTGVGKRCGKAAW
jgi:hypothetical protein